MSDVMFYGVLRMPYELVMSDELSRRQFYSRAQEAADRVAQLEADARRAAPSSPVADDGLPPLPEPCKAVLPLGWIRYTADQLRQAQRDAMAPLERKLRAFQAIFNAAPDEWAGLGAAPQPPKENS